MLIWIPITALLNYPHLKKNPICTQYHISFLLVPFLYTKSSWPYICWSSRMRLENTLTASLQSSKPITNDSHGYDTKQSDGEVPVMLELWGIQCIPLLPLLRGPLWPRVEAFDSLLSIGKIQQNYVLILYWTVWNRTVSTFNCLNKWVMFNWIVSDA